MTNAEESEMAVLSVKRPHANEGTPSKRSKQEPSIPPAMSLHELLNRIPILFPDSNVISIPCVSARLFACFTLVADAPKASTMTTNTLGARQTRRSSQHILLPLWQALVRVELTSLGPPTVAPFRQKVHFSGFDCSSTMPPVDSVWGSHHHWEASIASLIQAWDCLENLQSIATTTEQDNEHAHNHRTEVTMALQSLVEFLQTIEDNENGVALRVECSRSMPCPYPPERFQTAGRLYRLDLEKLLRNLTLDDSSSEKRQHETLFVQTQLGAFLGQAIRFYLRTLFNPVPWKVTKLPAASSSSPPLFDNQDRDYDDSRGRMLVMSGSKRRSRVPELVQMKLPDNVVLPDSAVADGSISSVVSVALRYLYDYFGSSLFHKEHNDDKVGAVTWPPHEFCASEASQGGLALGLSEAALADIVTDIHEAQSFLGASRACNFLRDLLNWPGVKEEIAKVGGWKLVERYASIFRRYNLSSCCPHDAHFEALGDVTSLLRRVEEYAKVMEGSVASCEATLVALSSRFKCGTKSKALKRKHPEIETIESRLKDGSRYTFPVVTMPATNSCG